MENKGLHTFLAPQGMFVFKVLGRFFTKERTKDVSTGMQQKSIVCLWKHTIFKCVDKSLCCGVLDCQFVAQIPLFQRGLIFVLIVQSFGCNEISDFNFFFFLCHNQHLVDLQLSWLLFFCKRYKFRFLVKTILDLTHDPPIV